MTRHPATIHALPVDAAGDHRPSASCPCSPMQATDLIEPSRLVVIHRHLPDVPDPAPPAQMVGKSW